MYPRENASQRLLSARTQDKATKSLRKIASHQKD